MYIYDGATISGGNATKYGGNIHMEKNTLTVSSTITGGTAGTAGGSISVNEGGTLPALP